MSCGKRQQQDIDAQDTSLDALGRTDLFISHHPADAEAVHAFAQVLRSYSLEVACEALDDDPETTISYRPRPALAAKAWLAWHTAAYRQQRTLQWELMSAIAAAQHSQEQARVIIINSGAQTGALLPASIAGRCRIESLTPATEQSTAKKLAAHLASLHGSLHQLANPGPPWLPYELTGCDRFVGRDPELWRLHEILSAPLRKQEKAPRTIVLSGAAGAGKSMLAQEYAARFASAYPGGIFCLDAGCLHSDSPGKLQAAREHAWYEFAARLTLPCEDREFAEISAGLHRHLARQALPFLWIVDHVPADMSLDDIRLWLAPHSLGRNILITRGTGYGPLGAQLQLESLRLPEAQILLTCRRKADPQGLAELPRLIEQLGLHTLAMDLAGAQLRKSCCEELALQVDTPTPHAQQLAGDFTIEASQAQRVAIAALLYRGIALLDSQARSCLRFCAVLADAPIPIALATTALAQQTRGGAHGSISLAELAVDELIDAALATRLNSESFCLSPLARTAVLAQETASELQAARNLAATTLAGELTLAPDPSYDNPYLRWIPHALHITETAPSSNQLIEITAWLVRYAIIGMLRTANRRALTCLNEGDLHKAQQLLDLELAATRRGLGHEHPGTLTAVNNLAALLGIQGDLAGARALFEHALAVRSKALGEQHPDTLTPLNNLAVILWSEADLEGAQALLECVVEQRRRWLGENHPETLVAMKNLAVTLRQRREFSSARPLLEHVVKVRQKTLGPQHHDTRAAIESLVRTLNEAEATLHGRATPRHSVTSLL